MRGSLVEGLEDISEEEQLKIALEMSKNDVCGLLDELRSNPTDMSVDSVRSEGPADHKFAEWCATPAEDRLQYLVGGGGAGASMTKDRQSENTALADDINPVNNYTFDSDDSNDDDEVLQRIIEQSKQDNQISDEEKTKLAVEQSKLDLLPMETLDENEQLEVAVKMSLGATYNKVMHARIPPPVSQKGSIFTDHEIPKSSSSTPPVLTPPLSVSPPSHPDTDHSVRPKTTRPTSLVSQPRIIPADLSPSFPPGAAYISPPPSPLHQSEFRVPRVPPPPSHPLPHRVRNQLHIATSPNRFSPLATSPPPSSPLGPDFPPMSEDQQLEMALKLSQEEAEDCKRDLRMMSEDDQLKLALKLSRSESASTVDISGKNSVRQKRGSGGGGSRFLAPLVPSHSSPSLPSQLSQRKPSQPCLPTIAASQPQPVSSQDTLRPIVVDGSNVGMAMGKNEVFRAQALSIVYAYFAGKKHEVIIFLPKSRWNRANHKDKELLDRLEKSEVLYYTPTRRTDTKSFDCYDDRYIVDYAVSRKGIIVTNDNYRDLIAESAEFRDQIENRLLPFTWVKERFMPPDDPLGKGGPRLAEFLRL